MRLLLRLSSVIAETAHPGLASARPKARANKCVNAALISDSSVRKQESI